MTDPDIILEHHGYEPSTGLYAADILETLDIIEGCLASITQTTSVALRALDKITGDTPCDSDTIPSQDTSSPAQRGRVLSISPATGAEDTAIDMQTVAATAFGITPLSPTTPPARAENSS